jgi:hypothetical protein
VFTRRLCSPETLDDKSRTKLDAAVALIDRELGREVGRDVARPSAP